MTTDTTATPTTETTPAAEETPAAAVPATKPARRRKAPAPGFASPAPRPPATPTTMGESGESPAGGVSAPVEGDPVEVPAAAAGSRAKSSSPASIGRVFGGKTQLREAVAEAVRLVGQVLNEFATRSEVEYERGLWLTDPDDQRNLSTPTTDLLWRHGELKVTPDGVSIVTGAIALARYVGRNLRLKLEIRREEAAMAPPEPPDDDERTEAA